MEAKGASHRPQKIQGASASGSHTGRSKPKRNSHSANIAHQAGTTPTSSKAKVTTHGHVRYPSSGKHSDGSSRPCPEHSFLTDVADVRQMEQGLLQLLDNFHSGKLQAFGQDCPFEKMDQVREQQERLARLHFEMDCQQEMTGMDTAEGKEEANKNLGKLMSNLQELCTSIQDLQKNESSAPHPPGQT